MAGFNTLRGLSEEQLSEAAGGLTLEEIGQALQDAASGSGGGSSPEWSTNRNYIPENSEILERVPSSNYMDSMSAAPILTVGFKKHLAAYAGNCCRVRRASDNTERDIPFLSDGVVNVRLMRSFANGSDLFLNTFYDQSGNGNDLTQATNADQPKVMTDQLVGGVPYIAGSSSNDPIIQNGEMDIPGAVSVDQSNCSVWMTLGYTNSWRDMVAFEIGTTDPFGIDLGAVSVASVRAKYGGTNTSFGDINTIPHMGSVVGLDSSSNLVYHVRDDEYSLSGIASATKSGGTVGRIFFGAWNSFTIFGASLSSTDVDIMKYDGAGEYAKSVNPDYTMLFLQGDSLAQGKYDANYSTALQHYLPGDVRLFMRGRGFEQASGFEADLSTYVFPLFISGRKNICVNMGGGNDILTGDSAANLISYWTDWATAVKAAGGVAIIATIVPVDIANSGQIAIKNEVNEWLRTTALNDGIVDDIIDFDIQTKILPEFPSKISPDGIHPNKEGYRIMTPILFDVVSRYF